MEKTEYKQDLKLKKYISFSFCGLLAIFILETITVGLNILKIKSCSKFGKESRDKNLELRRQQTHSDDNSSHHTLGKASINGYSNLVIYKCTCKNVLKEQYKFNHNQ